MYIYERIVSHSYDFDSNLQDEMEVVLTQMEPFCTGGGRASQLGCYVQTISWTNGVRDNENFQIMNSYIEQATKPWELWAEWRISGEISFFFRTNSLARNMASSATTLCNVYG